MANSPADMGDDQLTVLVSLTIQCAGIILVAILSFFMTKSIRRESLHYWAHAWASLACALTALLISFRVPAFTIIGQPLFFLGEFEFGFLFLAGCRNRATGAKLTRRTVYFSLLLFVPIAIALSYSTRGFGRRFAIQAAMMSLLFVFSWRSLKGAADGVRKRLGMRIMSAALLLLACDFLGYVLVVASALLAHVGMPPHFLQYWSVCDLILEIMLGFGAVIVVMDDVNRELEEANRELTTARDRLEVLARMDPLTEALNRHAFYSLTSEGSGAGIQELSGCVVVVDIDDLKPINDSVGHAAGDDVIRAVANLIRSVIRASDLLFRWGGDEFLVILFGVSESDVGGRIERLNRSVSAIALPGTIQPIGVTVSYGIAPFASASQIEQAIDSADRQMYQSKQSRKGVMHSHRTGTTAPLTQKENELTAI